MIATANITNPVLHLADNLRDPSVHRRGDGYDLFYTRYKGGDWNIAGNWSVGCCFTRDFVSFSAHRTIAGPNFASPGDVVRWHGRWVLPFQSYPQRPQKLFYAESSDGYAWSEPRSFLDEALNIAWNTDHRAIDPSFVVDGDHLHCFFVGSEGLGTPQRANLLGHAVTQDPTLEKWTILNVESPLMGRDRATDGVENVVVYRADGRWIMVLSEGIEDQHLAMAASDDLLTWKPLGRIGIPLQQWCSFRHGAPFVWEEEGTYFMILMGEEDAFHRSSLGFLTSQDGLHWEPRPETGKLSTLH